MGIDMYFDCGDDFPWRRLLERLVSIEDGYIEWVAADCRGYLVWCNACGAEHYASVHDNEPPHEDDCPYVAAKEALRKYYNSLSATAPRPSFLSED